MRAGSLPGLPAFVFSPPDPGHDPGHHAGRPTLSRSARSWPGGPARGGRREDRDSETGIEAGIETGIEAGIETGIEARATHLAPAESRGRQGQAHEPASVTE